MKSIEERIEEAVGYKRQGYNCAQSVAMAFAEEAAADPSEIAKMTAAMGSGMCALGEICGVVSGMAVVCGLKGGDGSSKGKIAATKEARLLGKEFEGRYGYLRCADLKRPGAPVPCEELVAGGARMLHAHLYPSDCE